MTGRLRCSKNGCFAYSELSATLFLTIDYLRHRPLLALLPLLGTIAMKQSEKAQSTQSKRSFEWFRALSFPSRFALSAIGVLLAALLYAAIVEVVNGESLVVVDIPLNNGDQLRVTWPSPSRITADAQEVEIVLSLLPAPDTIEERAYYISLQSLDRSLLLDANDNGYIVRHTLTSSSAAVVLTVRLAALQKELPDRIRLDLVIFDNSGDELLSIPPWWLWVEVGKTNIVQRAILWIVGKAEVLALIATVLLWWTDDTRRRQKEQTELRQRIEGIKDFRPEKLEDFQQLLQRILNVANERRTNPAYTEIIEQEFQDVCRSLVDQNKHWAEMLRMMGNATSEDSSSRITTIRDILVNLVNLKRFYTDIFADEVRSHYFSTIHWGLFKPIEDAQLETIFAKLMDCWRGRMYDDTALIAEAVARISVDEAGDPRQLSLEILIRECRENRELRSLLRHTRLQTLLTHSKELADIVSYGYRWPNARVVRPPSDSSKRLTEWLDQAGLRTHPFAEAVDYRHDQLLTETWLPPTSWDKLEYSGNLIAQFETPDDAELCIHYLLRQLRQPEFFGVLPTFPIRLAYRATVGSGEIADTILHSHTTTWFDFLSTNREAFEEMPETDQQMLAELFIWSAGSYSALRSWMLSRAKTVYAIDETYFASILRRIQYIATGTQSLDRPGLPKRLSWLAVRPPGYRQSYLVGTVHPDYTDLQYTNLLHLMPHLNEYHIYLKLFGYGTTIPASDRKEFAGIRSASMYWSEDSLRKVLDARVRKAFGMDFPFAALLERMDDPGERLVKAAGGSLTRLLALGYRLIDRHIQQREITKYISEDTFEAILQE